MDGETEMRPRWKEMSRKRRERKGKAGEEQDTRNIKKRENVGREE